MHWEVLSTRELATLELGSAGLRDNEIASRMEISTTSVRTYWARLRQKLGGLSRREAISAFKRHVNNREHQELENYRSLSKYAAIGMVQPSHSSWIIVNAGENFSKLLGKNRSEIVGKDFFTVLPTDQRAS